MLLYRTLDEALREFRQTSDARVRLEGDVEALRAEVERLRGLARELRPAVDRLRDENGRLRRQVADLSRDLAALRLSDEPSQDAAGDEARREAARLEGGVAEVPDAAGQARVVARREQVREVVAAAAEARHRRPGVRGGPILNGQLPGPSRQIRPAWAVGRRLVPSCFRDAAGVFHCPGCEWSSRQRSHAERHFRTRHGGAFYEEFEEQGERRRANGGRYRRERRRRQVRGLMAFEVVEEEEVEYDDDE
ncbi:hypothetical protein AAVH_36222 [Aphelenchoides avenae]|nr:hypothetical protein AAVH_36222 [Aphelenchus avenae]